MNRDFRNGDWLICFSESFLREFYYTKQPGGSFDFVIVTLKSQNKAAKKLHEQSKILEATRQLSLAICNWQ